MPVNKDSFILTDKEKISDFIGKISDKMYEYIQNRVSSSFVMFYKYLTHSDIATFGKATKPNNHQNNFLYYIKESDMHSIEIKTNKPFQTAHQSCISLKSEFYSLVGLPNPRETGYFINDYMNVYLVNETLSYFTSRYTELVFEKLSKTMNERKKASWDFNELNLNLSDGDFTSIDLHVAVHGLGVKVDKDFHKLRHHMFKGDTFILLCEIQNDGSKNLFIIPEKNPAFFSIIGESNKAFQTYQVKLRERLINKALGKSNAISNLDETITRQQQSAWRKMLANEMMSYTQVSNQVFCPFTYITGDFDEVGPLFRASHIKGFSDENTKDNEKYDINNGLLLCANADALFDKHLISVNDNKELVFSFLLNNDTRLKQQLLLLQPIFQPILNEKRMEYLSYHKAIFDAEEVKRMRE